MPPLGLAKGGHKFFKGGQCPPPRGGREVPWVKDCRVKDCRMKDCNERLQGERL